MILNRPSLPELFCLCVTAVRLASAASTISGELTDPQNRPVSGAAIRLVRPANSSGRSTTSDNRGRYTFGNIDPGEYRLTASSPGFPTITRTISVAAEATRTEDLHFSRVASRNQSVNV